MKPSIRHMVALLSLVALLAPTVQVGAQEDPVAPGSSGVLSFTIEAGDYALEQNEAGETEISMARDFGSTGEPGEPQLPGRVYMFALPPLVQVTAVRFDTPDAVCLPDLYVVAPQKVRIVPGDDIQALESAWAETRREAYAEGHVYGEAAGEYLGQGQWRRYAVGQVTYVPFSYEPATGRLCVRPSLQVTVEYSGVASAATADEYAALAGDSVMDDLILNELANPADALDWYTSTATAASAAATRCDYVIITPNTTVADHMLPFKNWKASLGHHVCIVPLDWIRAHYGGLDAADQLWSFLHAMYPYSAWGIRYVLLVGDLSVLPTRRLFYADTGWGLMSDHYYAKLSGGTTSAAVWNADSDARWGELDDDKLVVTPDVLVGRIPLNDLGAIDRAVSATIRFEQDTGDWKRSALLAGGYNDIKSAQVKTDNAVALDLVKSNILQPAGWNATRIYEQSGLGTSFYSPPQDYDTAPDNVVKAWNGKGHSLVVMSGHGWEDGLVSVVWERDANRSGTADDGETVQQILFSRGYVSWITNPKPAIAALLGCKTVALAEPSESDESSLRPPISYHPNTGSELLGQGAAAAVVGFYSTVYYVQNWQRAEDGGSNTFGYYFVENFVNNRLSLGWSLFSAKLRYTQRFWRNNYDPFHWSASLLGDPALVLEGYDLSARTNDRAIHTGSLQAYGYGADNDDNGDMYVAVVESPRWIVVYRSTDHGETWQRFARFQHFDADITSIDVLVGRWRGIPLGDQPYLHVVYTDAAGGAWDCRVSLPARVNSAEVSIAEAEQVKVQLAAPDTERAGRISIARDPVAMPSTFRIYVAWEVSSSSGARVKFAVSGSNGKDWSDPAVFSNRTSPSIDAGPNGRVYLVAQHPDGTRDVLVNRSEDRGQSWKGWNNLTGSDGASNHAMPVIAASTDPAVPTVWVAYQRVEAFSNGPEYMSVRMAYSRDGGLNWVRERILSSEPGLTETNPHMASYRSGPNRWMNIVYRRTTATAENPVWRWASGYSPMNWSAMRPMGTAKTYGGIGPQIVYSPGASHPGSGVIHAISGPSGDELRFSAPWLKPSVSRVYLPLVR